jgi:serine/threonine protein kinase
MQNYQQLDLLGQGTYGKVYKVRDRRTGGDFKAMKKCIVDQESEGVPVSSLREVDRLKRMAHPNIVKLEEAFFHKKKLYLVFEYMETDLHNYLVRRERISRSQGKDILRQILMGLDYCHRKGTLHRDLKPQNILIKGSNVQLADFGLARSVTKKQYPYTNGVQSLYYRAPEVILGEEEYQGSVDMWSVGCIFAELFGNTVLFRGRDELSQISEIFAKVGFPSHETWPAMVDLPKHAQLQAAIRPSEGVPIQQLAPALGATGLDLLGKMLTLDPAERISASEALAHPYFTE